MLNLRNHTDTMVLFGFLAVIFHFSGFKPISLFFFVLLLLELILHRILK